MHARMHAHTHARTHTHVHTQLLMHGNASLGEVTIVVQLQLTKENIIIIIRKFVSNYREIHVGRVNSAAPEKQQLLSYDTGAVATTFMFYRVRRCELR